MLAGYLLRQHVLLMPLCAFARIIITIHFACFIFIDTDRLAAQNDERIIHHYYSQFDKHVSIE